MPIWYSATFFAVIAAAILFVGCRRNAASSPSDTTGTAEWFSERAHDAGLDFVHFNGMSGKYLYPELMAPGVALFDYDNDGDLDVFIVQSGMLGKTPIAAARPQPQNPALKSRLFRNDGNRSGLPHFTDVTDASGINAQGYGMGVATGDFNNDGCVDLYITKLGRNQLYRNNCDGTFTDVSKASRTDDDGWSVSAVFFDYDRDGWPDLFVGHYLQYSVEANKQCFAVNGLLDYCPPHLYRPEPSRLLHNNHDGTFTDVTMAAGMSREYGPTLGVSAADFDGDGWIDLFVSNDSQQNQLWINQHDGTFRNTALLSGVALSPEGALKANMGVDAGDFDNDGDEDLFVGELAGQGHDLYVNNGTAVFDDRSAQAGIRLPSLRYTGFGAAWFDFDNDGWLDLLCVNGAVTQDVEAFARKDPFPLKQRPELFRNLRNGRFEDVSSTAGAFFSRADVSRGAAFGDIDNDGDTDVVIGTDAGPVRLLINNVGNRKHWVGLKVAVGARVVVTRADGQTIWRRARADGSYASANDPRVLVGLGDAGQPVQVRVIWPDGRSEEWKDVPVDRYSTLKEGTLEIRR
jgi:enediyne biosynthesis protein E4